MAVSVGDKVTTNAQYEYTGKIHLASFVRSTTYDVIQVGGKNLPADRIVIGIGGAVTAAVKESTLTVVSGKTTPIPAPAIPMAPTINIVENKVDLGISSSTEQAKAIYNKLKKQTKPTFPVTSINGSAVQQMQYKEQANQSSQYNETINKILENRKANQMSAAEIRKLDENDPSIVQNAYNFPKSKGLDKTTGYYRYNYYMDYEKDTLPGGVRVNSDMDNLHKALNLDYTSRMKLFQKYTESYDKFKLSNPNDRLAKTFSHVFFVRPDCNIFQGSASGSNPKLISGLENNSEFYYAKKHCPELLYQLTQAGRYDNEFMMYLSNKARSFGIADEYITSDTYGQGLTGFKIAYGKHDVESRTAKTFSITYVDDRDLHVYHLHKLWQSYISYVYRGKISPTLNYRLNKILDYPTCVYYIVCAEDGETIIFWSKYWGVFPIEAPSSQFSWDANNGGGFKDPELNVEYQYSWKEDFNPLSLIEFNMHSSNQKLDYTINYNDHKLGTGYAWGGAPFVETFNDSKSPETPYTFKLRFRKD